LLFGALIDALWRGVATHVMAGFLMAATIAHWFVEIFSARTPRGRLRQTYCLLTLPFLLSKLWSPAVTSMSTDLPLSLLGVVLVLELVSLPKPRTLLPLAFVLALGAVGMTTKLGGAAMFAVTGLAAVVTVWRGVTWRARITLFALPAVLLLGWFARGVVISG